MLVDGSPPGEHTVSALMPSLEHDWSEGPNRHHASGCRLLRRHSPGKHRHPNADRLRDGSPRDNSDRSTHRPSPTARPTRDPTAVPTAVPTPLPTPVPPPQATPVPPRPTTPPATGGGLAMPAGSIWSDGFGGSTLNSANWRRETVFDGQTDTFAKWGQFSGGFTPVQRWQRVAEH